MPDDYKRMRWENGLIDDISELIGPAIAKELEKATERAIHLARLCSLWLQYCEDDTLRAETEEPTIPPVWTSGSRPGSAEFYKNFKAAYDGCGAFDRPSRPEVWPEVSVTKTGKIRKVAGKVANPMQSRRWDWRWVFNYWFSGGLERGIGVMLATLPAENAERIKKVMTA